MTVTKRTADGGRGAACPWLSVRRRGEQRLGTKTEVKNMNSFRNVERALEFEIQRQTRLIDDGGTVAQETLLWDAERGVALPMRSKEESHDYRYFPEPDLVPVTVDEERIAAVRSSLPELPAAKRDIKRQFKKRERKLERKRIRDELHG